MCIRDSLDHPRTFDNVIKHALRQNGGDRNRIPYMRARLGLCLLYTSDAADERSSVDLGGRRIIK